MPENMLQTGGAGAGGAFLGAIMTFFGFKGRLDRLESNVMYKDTCNAKLKGIEQGMTTHAEALKYLAGQIGDLGKKIDSWKLK